MSEVLYAPTGSATAIMPAGTWFIGGEGQHLDWSITPLASGSATFDTGPTEPAGPNPSSDTILRVGAVNGPVFQDDDGSSAGGGRSRVTLEVTAGVTYNIEVSLYPGSTKTSRLGIVYTGPSTASNMVVTQTGATTTTVDLAWTPTTPPPSGYEVTVGAGPAVDVGLSLTHIATGLATGTTYPVTVRPYNDSTQPGAPITVSSATQTGVSPGSEGVANLVDGNPGSKWLTFDQPASATLTLSARSTVAGYTITSGNDASERDPRSWTVEGSDDGTTWVLLDTRTDEPVWPGRGVARNYAVPTPRPFALVRWTITATRAGLFQAGELTLTAAGVPVRAYGSPATTTASTAAEPAVGIVDPRWWTHRLAAQLGLDGVTAQPVVELRRWVDGAWVLDEQLSRALTGYRITYARKDAAGRTPPMAATLSLITARAGLLPIGTRLQLALSAAVCERLGLEPEDGVRWTGEVTDPTVDYDGRLTTLTCVGRLGRTNRQTIDTTSWPRAHADALVPMITTAARTGMATSLVEPGGGILQPPGVTTAGTLLDALVDSTGGQLVEQPAGHLDWHGPDHRRGMVPRMTLTAAAVLRRITWSQSVSDLVNVVDVAWGDGQKAIVEDTSSSDPATGYGPYTASVDTLLVTESDAYDLGMLVVGRRATPVWRLPDLTVAPDVMHAAGHLPTADLATLLSLRHGERLSLAGLPAGCPIPAGVILEGWEETATPRAWRITLSVSDPKQSGVSLRWVDIDPDVAWTDIHPAVRWLDIARMETSDELLSPPT